MRLGSEGLEKQKLAWDYRNNFFEGCEHLLWTFGTSLVIYLLFFLEHGTDASTHMHAHTLTPMNVHTHTLPL
uniref:Uncharacterized protein n=1 Tax=Aegilops tauschii subsp. strangulata TaxID=200361 RepID=A0A453DK02_AEGTS